MFRYFSFLFIFISLFVSVYGCEKSNDLAVDEKINVEDMYVDTPVLMISNKGYTEKDIYEFNKLTINEMDEASYSNAEVLKFLVDKFVEYNLLLNEANRLEVVFFDTELDRSLNSLRTAKGAYDLKIGTDSYYTDNIDMIKDINNMSKIEMLISKVSEDNLTVTENEILAYYNSNRKQFTNPYKVHVSHIYSADLVKIEKAYAELQKGFAFSEVAERFSDSPDAVDGGDLGFIEKDSNVSDIFDSVFKLKVNKYSKVLKSETNGYHIFYVSEFKPGGIQRLTAAKAEIIEFIKQKKKQDKLEVYIDELYEKADIKIVNDFNLDNYSKYIKSRKN